MKRQPWLGEPVCVQSVRINVRIGSALSLFYRIYGEREREREREREYGGADRQRERERERRGGQTDRQINRQMDSD